MLRDINSNTSSINYVENKIVYFFYDAPVNILIREYAQ